jgi:hypothetical protein
VCLDDNLRSFIVLLEFAQHLNLMLGLELDQLLRYQAAKGRPNLTKLKNRKSKIVSNGFMEGFH